MNKVFLSGRLVRDPELKIFNHSTSLCTFYIAGENNPRKSEKSGLYKCTAWGKPGRSLAYHAEKGSVIMVTGRLHQKKAEDKNGNTVYEVNIIVENFSLRKKMKTEGANAQTAGSQNSDKTSIHA